MRDDERPYAAIAHFFAAVPIWGIVVAVIIWLNFKERSREVVFHAQQAIFFHAAMLALALPALLGAVLRSLLSAVSEGLANFIGTANVILLCTCWILCAGICIYGAIVTFSGGQFLYPVIGPRLAEGYQRNTIE